MSKFDIARAWKDEEYRNSLTEAQKAQLPQNPAGEEDLEDEDLAKVSGGLRPTTQIGTTCDCAAHSTTSC